jgi:hypothetical protein
MTVATSSGSFSIVCRNGKWKVIDRHGKPGKKISPNEVPVLAPPETITVQHVIGDKKTRLPKHPHPKSKSRKKKAGGSHLPYNTHCHKTIYIGGVPYLVHC